MAESTEIPKTRLRVLQFEGYWEVKEPRISEHNGHRWHTREQIPRDGRWTFNGDFENPSFAPSINASHGGDAESRIPFFRNHFIITDGRIQYCHDCTHEFAQQTFDLEYFNDAEVKWLDGKEPSPYMDQASSRSA